MAREKVGRALVANIVALGVIAGLSNIVSIDALLSAIEARVPKGTEELNIKAFHVGLDEIKKMNDLLK